MEGEDTNRQVHLALDLLVTLSPTQQTRALNNGILEVRSENVFAGRDNEAGAFKDRVLCIHFSNGWCKSTATSAYLTLSCRSNVSPAIRILLASNAPN